MPAARTIGILLVGEAGDIVRCVLFQFLRLPEERDEVIEGQVWLVPMLREGWLGPQAQESILAVDISPDTNRFRVDYFRQLLDGVDEARRHRVRDRIRLGKNHASLLPALPDSVARSRKREPYSNFTGRCPSVLFGLGEITPGRMRGVGKSSIASLHR